MSAHRFYSDWSQADATFKDPGNAGVLPVSQCCFIPLDTAGAETRTLAVPVKAGLRMVLYCRTYVGNCVITVANGFDEAGGTTLTFTAAGQFVELISVEDGSGTFRWRVADYDGVTGPTTTIDTLKLGGTTLLATGAELNRAADQSTRIVNATATTLAVTVADHDGKTIVLDRAGGIAVTLPDADAAAVGAKFRFWVKTTFTGAASIKSSRSADVMIGHALHGNDSDNTTVLWQALAASTFDTINLFGTANSTGGIAGQTITIECLAANVWGVESVGDAAGTEATPFENTVS